jgi:hypothetical protein
VVPLATAYGADVVNSPHPVADDNAEGFARHVTVALRTERVPLMLIARRIVRQPSVCTMPDRCKRAMNADRVRLTTGWVSTAQRVCPVPSRECALVVRKEPHEGNVIVRNHPNLHPLLTTEQAVIVNGSQAATDHDAHRFSALVAFRTTGPVFVGLPREGIHQARQNACG